jgi:hypothetical protein
VSAVESALGDPAVGVQGDEGEQRDSTDQDARPRDEGEPAGGQRDEDEREQRAHDDDRPLRGEAQAGRAERVLVQAEPVPRRGQDDERQREQDPERDPQRGATAGRAVPQSGGDDGEREGRDDEQLREALACVLGVRQPGGLQHVVLAAEEHGELDADERREQDVERDHADEPLGAGQPPRGRRQLAVRAGAAGEHEPARQGDRRRERQDAQHDEVEVAGGRQRVLGELGERPVGRGEEHAEDADQPGGEHRAPDRGTDATRAVARRRGPRRAGEQRRARRRARQQRRRAVAESRPRRPARHGQRAERERRGERRQDHPGRVAQHGRGGEQQCQDGPRPRPPVAAAHEQPDRRQRRRDHEHAEAEPLAGQQRRGDEAGDPGGQEHAPPHPAGSSTTIRVPCGSPGSTWIVPPCSSTIQRAIDSPRPAPPPLRASPRERAASGR